MYVSPQSQQRAAVGAAIVTKQGGRGKLKYGMSAAHVKKMTEVSDLVSSPM